MNSIWEIKMRTRGFVVSILSVNHTFRKQKIQVHKTNHLAESMDWNIRRIACFVIVWCSYHKMWLELYEAVVIFNTCITQCQLNFSKYICTSCIALCKKTVHRCLNRDLLWHGNCCYYWARQFKMMWMYRCLMRLLLMLMCY